MEFECITLSYDLKHQIFYEIDNMSQTLDTGDILLFRGNGVISKVVECFGSSRYSHVGMIVRNPSFLHPDMEDGIYLMESSWNPTPDAEDHQVKLGVQIHKLSDILPEFPKGSIYVRKIYCERNQAFYDALKKAHEVVHNKPYDENPFDWIRAKYNELHPFPADGTYQSTKSFWCSALLSYLFCKVGLLDSHVNWSLIAPREFSSIEGRYLSFRCEMGEDMLLECV
jgi:hypothetical protein